MEHNSSTLAVDLCRQIVKLCETDSSTPPVLVDTLLNDLFLTLFQDSKQKLEMRDLAILEKICQVLGNPPDPVFEVRYLQRRLEEEKRAYRRSREDEDD